MDTIIETQAARTEPHTPTEGQLAAQYGMTVEQMRNTVEATTRYPDIACDENGIPAGCTVEQWFDELDKQLIEHFGDEFRVMANERRTRWNQHGRKFDMF